MRYICCIVVLLLSLPLGNLSAQDTLALAPGARVRVTAPVPDCEAREARFCPRRQEIGTLVSIDSLTIVMNDARGIRRELPRGPYTRLDLSAGSGACGGPPRPFGGLRAPRGAGPWGAGGLVSVPKPRGRTRCGGNAFGPGYLGS